MSLHTILYPACSHHILHVQEVASEGKQPVSAVSAISEVHFAFLKALFFLFISSDCTLENDINMTFRFDW